MPEINTGMIFMDIDHRLVVPRILKVTSVQGDTVHITNAITGRRTKAKMSRFNGKGNGYREVTNCLGRA